MEPVKQIRSKTVVIPFDDIDTDQIIPARFLTTTTKEGLGKQLFYDWRYNPDGSTKPEFVLTKPENKGAAILIGGHNFGCGSSREHAPWALVDFGIRAVVSTEIADIFRSNSLKNGLVPIIVDKATHQWLLANPGIEATVDVASSTLTAGDKRVTFPIDKFSRYCLLNGVDQLGFLREHEADIARYEQARA
ncbi:MAG TPA: 3-isopropylmalate dehydratase small subunit [Gammaproteobacteria bacterium]|nr:3-isopropylmalate dehydratase small subunit [Gammaproteobacteria bacterium]